MKRISLFIILCFAILASSGCGNGGGGSAISATGITLSDIAGTWDYMGSGTQDGCTQSFSGNITIQPNGSASISEKNHSSCGDMSGSNLSGFTVSVLSDGSGTVTSPFGSQTVFRVSKNADVMIVTDVANAGSFFFQVALKR